MKRPTFHPQLSPRRDTRHARRRRGFTLVELLTVSGIFGILLTVGFSVVVRARIKALSTISAANLRALASANLMYANDHGGRFCPAQDKANLNRWHGSRPSLNSPYDPNSGYLSPYLEDGGKARVCPVFLMYQQSAQTFESGAGGYGYNAAYIGGTPESPYIPELLSRVRNPSRTIMFTDAALPRSDGVQEYPYCEPYNSVNPDGSLGGGLSPSVHFRHDGLAHVAWCDGAVTAEPPARFGGRNLYGGDGLLYQIGWLGPSANNGWWNARSDANDPPN